MSNQRRTFIKSTAMLGLTAAVGNPSAFALASNQPHLEKGALVLFQGDSITDGNRGRNEDPNHIMGHGYAYAIASRIGADFPESDLHFINRGISGNTVSDLLKRWKEDAIDLQPQLLSILVGINDINALLNGFTNAKDFESSKKDYRTILDQALKENPNLLIVLGLPFVTRGSRTNALYEPFEKAVAEWALYIQSIASEYQALVVDYPKLFEKAYQKREPAYWIWDGVHPTVFGHELMAREWIRVVSKKWPFLKQYHY